MKLRFAMATLLAVIMGLTGAAAGAHQDYNRDGLPSENKRCDTWYRQGHHKNGPDGRHSDDHTNEFDEGEIQGTGIYVHNHTGHYVVRHEAFYVEVVGGDGLRNDENNQGGYAQFEVDAADDAPDIDGHASTFAGTNGAMHEENACVSAGDNKVGDEGEQPGN